MRLQTTCPPARPSISSGRAGASEYTHLHCAINRRENTMSEESIHEACGRGDIDAVRAMIAADPALVDADDEHGWRPIFHAGLWRQEQVVRFLIEAGADLAANDGYVMHYA